MNANYALPPRPQPVSWNRRFTRFGWLGVASRGEAPASYSGRHAADYGTDMISKNHFSHRAAVDSFADDRLAGDVTPRLSRTARAQLGNRLKALYDCDQATMPDLFRDLLARIDCVPSRNS